VFVDGGAEDSPLAEQVCEALKQYGAGYVLPERRGTAAEMRQELERNLEDCDALIVVYGASDRGWVDEQAATVPKGAVETRAATAGGGRVRGSARNERAVERQPAEDVDNRLPARPR
jgi:hypothetical protein